MKLKNREKVLIFLMVIALAIWVFDQFYYTPQSKRISRLREEIKAADMRLKEDITNAQGLEAVETEVLRLEKEWQKLNERTLRGEEFRAFLKQLGRESDRLQMKMVSLLPQEQKVSLPEEGRGRSALRYRRVTVQVVLHATYTSLEAYLKEIEELPFLVTIDHLQIERQEEIFPLLKVTMDLMVHIIS
jgi:Tfp pilus assembly protein PilO